jgi:hypothetical protein
VIGYIHLEFEWLWVIFALVLIGGPMLTVLMTWRIITDTGWARRWAGAVLAALGILAGALAIFFEADRTSPDLEFVVAGLGLLIGIPAWLTSAFTTRRGRIWADLVVLILPVLIGLWIWFNE